jgi:hypothetical protein
MCGGLSEEYRGSADERRLNIDRAGHLETVDQAANLLKREAESDVSPIQQKLLLLQEIMKELDAVLESLGNKIDHVLIPAQVREVPKEVDSRKQPHEEKCWLENRIDENLNHIRAMISGVIDLRDRVRI